MFQEFLKTEFPLVITFPFIFYLDLIYGVSVWTHLLWERPHGVTWKD